MKLPFYIFILISFVGFSQNDFESRYYTIDMESLPEVPQIPTLLMELENNKNKVAGTFTLGSSPSYQETRNSFTINSSNYWQPVDMTEALSSTTVTYDNTQFTATQLQKKQFGFSVSGNGGKTSFEFGDGETKVQNTVYQRQVPFYDTTQGGIYRPRPYPLYRNGYLNY